MTAQPNEKDDAFLAGYLRGIEVGTRDGHAAGYAEGLAVLDDAADALAELKPSRSVEWAEARARRTTYTAPARSAAALRIEAARSWGLPIPADLTDHVDDQATETPDAALDTRAALDACHTLDAHDDVADLSDEDDWVWSG